MKTALADLVASKRILVTVGAGGVGKTTVAASLGLAGASLGRKSLVLTIDPARRLANSLGLKSMGNSETCIDRGSLAAVGIDAPRGLYAMMLDAKSTFDAVVEKYAPSPAVRDAILANEMYRHVSSSLSGSQSHMAMEKLLEVSRERDYELVVLDTPPTAHALDFLDVPRRMVAIMESPVLRTFLRPMLGSKTSKRLFFGSSFILSRLAKGFTGMQMLQDLATYLVNFSEMFEGFRDRAKSVYDAFKTDEVAFVLVTSPHSAASREALIFYRRLISDRMPVGAFVVNRVHPEFDGKADVGEMLDRVLGHETLRTMPRDAIMRLVKRLGGHRDDLNRLAAAERAQIEAIRREVGATPVILLQALEEDVHSLAGLAELRLALVDGDSRIRGERASVFP